MIDGAQDTVNVNQLGRPLHDPERFARFKSEVDKAAEKAGVDQVYPFEPVATGQIIDGVDNDLLVLGGILGFLGIVLFATR